MHEFVDIDAELSVMPDAAISRIVGWVGDQLGGTAAGVLRTRPGFHDTANEEFNGRTLFHRARQFGAHGLFGVETWCRDDSPAVPGAASIVIMLNNGVAPQVGPARAWVDFSRRWASAGRHVVRVDLSGIGNSPVRPGGRPNDSYPVCAGDDVADVVRAFSEVEQPQFSIVGLCSGALLAYDAALVNPEISRIVSINGRFDKPYADRRADRRKRAADPTNRLLSIPLSKTPLFPYFDGVPTAFWKLLAASRLVASPSVAIAEAARRGVHSQLIFGDSEWGLHALQRRDGSRFQRLCRMPEVELVLVPGLDHSMFAAGMSAVVERLIAASLPSAGGRPERAEQRGLPDWPLSQSVVERVGDRAD
jgi:pimeloyl-ACP methyl ester carboxylesterase